MEATKNNGSRGGGRLRNRGGGGPVRNRGRGRGRGRGVARSLHFAMGQPVVEDAVSVSSASFAVAGPSQPTTSMVEERKKIKMRALDKKNMAQLPDEQRARLQELRDRKEVSQFLMPDAPPSKNRRKVSPVRVSCPLVPGTPEVPPPRIPQKWELQKSALDESEPSRFELVKEEATTPPPSKENQLVCTPSKGLIILGEGQEVDEHNILVDANIEMVGFPPGPSTSFTRAELSIYEEDPEEEILQCEHSAVLNPGSDVEEEDCLDGFRSSRRHAGEFAVEDLSSELREVLGSIDRQDDCALQESSQEDLLIFDWSHDPQVFVGVRENFTGPAGPTFPIEGMSPFQVFSKIWDGDIINLIVDETNKYAANLVSSPIKQFSRMRKWTPITPQELWTFIGVIMLQSIIPLPVEKEYWFPCLPYLKLGKFADIMAYHRFSLIKRCLHFVDNILCGRGIPTKLMKIQPVIDHLNTKFSSLYLPEQEIAIDESLMLWKGRLSFAQLIATKAAQIGIKSYELCESKTGYLWQMIVYTGKKERHNDENEAEPEGATSRTVLKLVRPLLNRGHTLVMDNFYNSPLLARTLKAQKTDVMGTLRLNREFVPDSLRYKNKANMRTGEVAFSQTRDMTITVWKDTNVVSLISTYHKVEVGGKEKYGYYRYKPKVVLDYNLAMGGVDKKDQLLQAFPIERVRNLIWYKKLFRRLLNVSIHNAFVMFSKSGTVKMAQRQFRVLLADEIIQRFRPPKIERPLPITSHFPAKTNVRKSRCKWCALKKVDACTAYKCESCNVNLCIINCFKDYHISRGLVKSSSSQRIIFKSTNFT
ncbi:piggyBac transposable element-derived protein 4 isoform X2 [Helicoverpa armigera]